MDIVDWITTIYELLSVDLMAGLVFCAFMLGMAAGRDSNRKLFKKYEGIELHHTSEKNSYEAWAKMSTFVLDRFRLYRDGAIDDCKGWGFEGLDLSKMTESQLSTWLRESNCGYFVWLCNTLGIQIDLSTKDSLEPADMTEEEKEYFSEHYKPWHGRIDGKYFSLLLLSGGALMSIIAFVLVLVMC